MSMYRQRRSHKLSYLVLRCLMYCIMAFEAWHTFIRAYFFYSLKFSLINSSWYSWETRKKISCLEKNQYQLFHRLGHCQKGLNRRTMCHRGVQRNWRTELWEPYPLREKRCKFLELKQVAALVSLFSSRWCIWKFVGFRFFEILDVEKLFTCNLN